MERVIERLNLVKVELRDLIVDLAVTNKTLKEISSECKDDFETKLIEENYKDNEAIISDSKIDIEEINQVIEVLTAATEMSNLHKKRP